MIRVAPGCSFLLLLMFASAEASCPDPAPVSRLAPGEMGLFFDPDGRVTCRETALQQKFAIYLVARVPSGGIERFDVPRIQIEGSASVGSGDGLLADPRYMDVAAVGACRQAVASDGTECPSDGSDVLALVRFSAERTSEDTDLICLEDFLCPGPGGTRSVIPSYSPCRGGPPFAAFVWGEMRCLNLTGERVASPTTNWGVLKAAFER